MSLTTHISMLEGKHVKLERALEAEVHRPLPDFSAVQMLKKQKLMIKEELERLWDAQRDVEQNNSA